MTAPASWTPSRAGWVVREIDERAGTAAEDLPLLSVSEYRGVVPRRSDGQGQSASEDLGHYKVCQPDDIVLNRLWAFRGGLGRSSGKGLVSPDYAVLRPVADADPRFVAYLFRSPPFVAEMAARSRGIGGIDASNGRSPRINIIDFNAIPVVLPSHEVQRDVADLLDTETDRIDTLVATNERAVELAGERYRALRRELIAAGGALGDPLTASRLSDRGWRIAPLWMVSRNHDAKRVPLNAVERGAIPGPYPYWGANSVQDHINDWIFEQDMVLIGEDGAPYFVEDRDVAWVATGRYWVNNHAHVVEAVDTSTRWLAECLNVVDYALFVGGSTRDKLTQADLNAIPVPVPPPDVEQDILKQLRHERELLDGLAARVSANIALLRERKQALITAAVTGQLDI